MENIIEFYNNIVTTEKKGNDTKDYLSLYHLLLYKWENTHKEVLKDYLKNALNYLEYIIENEKKQNTSKTNEISIKEVMNTLNFLMYTYEESDKELLNDYLSNAMNFIKYTKQEEVKSKTTSRRQGDVVYVDLPPAPGSRISGIRPCVVVGNLLSNKYSPLVEIIPITTKPTNGQKTHVSLTPDDFYIYQGQPLYGVALGEQRQSVSVSQLGTKVGELKRPALLKVIAADAFAVKPSIKNQVFYIESLVENEVISDENILEYLARKKAVQLQRKMEELNTELLSTINSEHLEVEEIEQMIQEATHIPTIQEIKNQTIQPQKVYSVYIVDDLAKVTNEKFQDKTNVVLEINNEAQAHHLKKLINDRLVTLKNGKTMTYSTALRKSNKIVKITPISEVVNNFMKKKGLI